MKTFIVKKTAGNTLSEITTAIANGGKFVSYCYCVSIVALTFKPSSAPYFIKPGEKASKYSGKYNLYSLLFGWWGLPWGPIHTIDRVKINLIKGGIDITDEILRKIQSEHGERNSNLPFEEDIVITYTPEELVTTNSRVGNVKQTS